MARFPSIPFLTAFAVVVGGGLRAETENKGAPIFVFNPPPLDLRTGIWCGGGVGRFSPASSFGKVNVLLRKSDEKYDLPPRLRPSAEAGLIYPYQMLRAGIAGAVVIKFNVEADGTISKADILSASQPGFAKALSQRMDRLNFTPARKDGIATRSVVTYEFVFELEEDL